MRHGERALEIFAGLQECVKSSREVDRKPTASMATQIGSVLPRAVVPLLIRPASRSLTACRWRNSWRLRSWRLNRETVGQRGKRKQDEEGAPLVAKRDCQKDTKDPKEAVHPIRKKTCQREGRWDYSNRLISCARDCRWEVEARRGFRRRRSESLWLGKICVSGHLTGAVAGEGRTGWPLARNATR